MQLSEGSDFGVFTTLSSFSLLDAPKNPRIVARPVKTDGKGDGIAVRIPIIIALAIAIFAESELANFWRRKMGIVIKKPKMEVITIDGGKVTSEPKSIMSTQIARKADNGWSPIFLRSRNFPLLPLISGLFFRLFQIIY